ncbi:MAG: helix-turn-helix domain-containing protein, partial [Sciscionella sp.]
MEKTVMAHRGCLPEPDLDEPEVEPTVVADPPKAPSKWMVQRHRERHAAIHALLAKGRSRTEVARELGISTRTVYRFADVTVEQLIGKADNRTSTLDRFKTHLHQRWNDGVTNASVLHRELEGLGWRGGVRTVERYAAQLRLQTTPPPVALVTPKPRRVAGWIMSDPEHLSADSSLAL